MNRRHFLSTMGGLPLIGSLNGVAWAATEPTANVALATPYNKLLILTKNADESRPEMQQAKVFLTSR